MLAAHWRRLAVCGALAAIQLGVMLPSSRAVPIPQSPPVIYTREETFAIPFHIDQPRASEPRAVEIELHVSEDRGTAWRRAERMEPSGGRFTFHAPRDGEYWFFVRTLDKQGRLLPDTPAAAELRVVVDTVPPRVELSAWRDALGETTARWRIIEPNLEPGSLTLTCRDATAGSTWRKIAVDTSTINTNEAVHTAQVSWRSAASDGLSVRIVVKDRAGNEAIQETRLGPDSTARRTAAGAGAAAADLASHGNSAQGIEAASPSDRAVPPPELSSHFPDDTGNLATGGSPETGQRRMAAFDPFAKHVNPSPPSATAATGSRRDTDQTFAAIQRAAKDHLAKSQADVRHHRAPLGSTPRPALAGDPPRPAQVTSDSVGTFQGEIASRYPAAPRTTPIVGFASLRPGERPHVVGSSHFELDYVLEPTDLAGGGRVELWLTTDAGATWRFYGTDDDGQSPMRVSLDEGLYGFLLRTAAAGISTRPPLAGTPPEVWVDVDLTPPVARLRDVKQGTAERSDKLLIRWEASDPRLAARPVALLYSSGAQGPWSLIASGLENTGSYVWSLPARLPRQIYLRLEVQDAAGNVQVSERGQPVSLRPVDRPARIRGVRASNELRRAVPSDWYHQGT